MDTEITSTESIASPLAGAAASVSSPGIGEVGEEGKVDTEITSTWSIASPLAGAAASVSSPGNGLEGLFVLCFVCFEIDLGDGDFMGTS